MARKKYKGFVEKGISQGKRPDLTGCGLLRSVGGWTAPKGFRKTCIRVKGDERILGDSDFVIHALKAADEQLEQEYALKASGYDFDGSLLRVAQVLGLRADEVTAL